MLPIVLYRKVRFLPVSDEKVLREHGVFYKPSTLRQWFNQGKYPKLFKKMGGKIFIDLFALDCLIEANGDEKVLDEIDEKKVVV